MILYHNLLFNFIKVDHTGTPFFKLKHVRQLTQEIRKEKSKKAGLAGESLEVMQAQFASWQLSSSEADVALLLIRGRPMKEVARVRDVQEKMVQHQATSIYARSGYA